MDQLLERLGTTWIAVVALIVSSIAVYVVVIVLTRLAGVRSLAKMSSFDFAATVAVGSTVASTALGSSPLSHGVLVLGMLFLLQYTVATLRRRDLLHGLVDNRPMLLMADERILEGNMQHARVSREELYANLRKAGVHQLSQIRAVVMESTGDMTVLRRGEAFDDELFQGIRGIEELR